MQEFRHHSDVALQSHPDGVCGIVPDSQDQVRRHILERARRRILPRRGYWCAKGGPDETNDLMRGVLRYCDVVPPVIVDDDDDDSHSKDVAYSFRLGTARRRRATPSPDAIFRGRWRDMRDVDATTYANDRRVDDAVDQVVLYRFRP